MDNQILEILTKMQSQMDRIETKVDNLDEKVNKLDSKVKTLEAGQKEINQKLDGITNQVHDLTEFATKTELSLAAMDEKYDFILHKDTKNEMDLFSIKKKLQVIK